MNRPTNTALKIAGIAVALSCLGGALTGCGDSDSGGGSDGDAAASAPKGVTTDGFCEKLKGLYEKTAGVDPDDTAVAIKGIKEWAAEIEDYGTPSEMSEEAQDGFDVLISTFEGIDDDATAEELQGVGSDASAADKKVVEAFGAWTTKNCPAPAAPDAPSDDAS